MFLASHLGEPTRSVTTVEGGIGHGPTLQPGGDGTPGPIGGGSGIRTHGDRKATHAFQACRIVRSRIPPGTGRGRDPGAKGIVAVHPFWSVAVGSCAIGARESSQGRKAAALSGTSEVPQITWPPRSRTGACRFLRELLFSGTRPGSIVDP